ncbi:hypothetical protein LDENG_00160510 [Lucifuga dentata]|nr:hypothetical protein LDENG_00160510 [Lucifuga dentata]
MWHVDSYDKLEPFGICVNGSIDGYSRKVLWLNAYHTSSDPKVIAGYLLETVVEVGGCPAFYMMIRALKIVVCETYASSEGTVKMLGNEVFYMVGVQPIRGSRAGGDISGGNALNFGWKTFTD